MEEYVSRPDTVVENINNLLVEKDLLDLRVRVEDAEFQCHRVVVAASSHFFRACLRSDMKEAKDGYITLFGISAPTFKTVLYSLYTGNILLTIQNFIEIWKVADQLQIDFIMQECETFALKVLSEETFLAIWHVADQLHNHEFIKYCEDFAVINISVKNFESITKTAKSFKSNDLLTVCKSFMLNNFDSVCQMKTIMELGIDEILSLIESRDLIVSSEDLVLETVLKWVKYLPDETNGEDHGEESMSTLVPRKLTETQLFKKRYERMKMLPSLLKSVRSCLVSAPLLKHVLKHPLIAKNTSARDLIVEAILYKTTNNNYGQWSTAAIHRACSDLEHCGIVYINNNNFNIITAFDTKLFKCVKNDEICHNVNLAVFESNVYATGVKDQDQAYSSLCVLSDNSWSKVTEIPGRQLILVPFDQCIFIINTATRKISQIFPNDRNSKVIEFAQLPGRVKVQQAITYQRMILMFCSVVEDSKTNSAVYQLDIPSKKFTELKKLDGPAEYIISFSDDNNTYVLQANGNLWKIVYSFERLTFQCVASLWNWQRKVYGALTYKEKLIILGSKTETTGQNKIKCLKGYFSEIKHFGMDSQCSNFIPVVLPKYLMLPM